MFLGFASEVYVYCVVAGKVCSANRFDADVLSLREDICTCDDPDKVGGFTNLPMPFSHRPFTLKNK
jgi:hypothetical protein